MKFSELKGKSNEDLQEIIDDCKEQLFQLRFAAETDKVDNPAKIRDLRKTVARAKTLLREAELETAKGEAS